MSAVNLPPCPPSLKPIQHYLKAAAEHDARDIVVAYWCRLFALQLALKLDKSSPESKKLLVALMDWLEKTKSAHKDNEAVVHDIPAQAHLENYALKLFLWADSQDRASVFNKNVVKAFYTAGVIYDVLDTFGEPTEEVQQNKKYAKWKAAYIHNCLKNGETPVPGPMVDDSESLDEPLKPSNVTPTPPAPGFPMPPDTGSFGMPSGGGPPYPVSGNGNNAFIPPVIPTVTPSITPSVIPPEPPAPSSNSEEKTKPLSPSEILDFTDPSAAESLTNKSSGMQLTPEQVTKAQKYCKWAASALNYDDVPTAVSNLQKALHLLLKGEEL